MAPHNSGELLKSFCPGLYPLRGEIQLRFMSQVQVEHQSNCPYALLDLEGRGAQGKE